MQVRGKWLAAALAACVGFSCATAAALSVYEIQYSTDPGGDSPHVSETVDLDGAVVVHKYPGSAPKLILQDPARPDGWGGITVKDFTGGGMYDAVSVGDLVTFTGVDVEESRGNTQLDYSVGSGYAVVSSGNALPAPKTVALSEIAAPLEGAPGDWYVADHSAEKYEAMRLRVEDVTVSGMDLGKAGDNYNLTGAADVWAADYMNEDAVGDYDPLVSVGQHFDVVTGILEQYTKLSSGWDYYQLLTTSSDDLVVTEADIIPEPCFGFVLLAGLACAARARPRREGRR